MENYRFVPMLLIFLSPLLFILSGCEWRPDAPGEVIHVKTSDFLTPKPTPVVAPPKPAEPKPQISVVKKRTADCDCGPNCPCNPCTCKADDKAIPIPDNANMPKPVQKLPDYPTWKPPVAKVQPLTAEQRAGLQQDWCSDGSCGTGYSEPRRGIFGRWRR